MKKLVYRSIQTPIRQNASYDERWNYLDQGLITAWEVGRELREKEIKNTVADLDSDEVEEGLLTIILNGELPALGFKGGIEKKTKQKLRYGTLHYLAQLQGIKNENLEIDCELTAA
mgnify:CR=1 FL=1|tara:strand:- start:27 stop:374 length:348 start_codon:yes stop_codon:yes gene_type:complete